MYKPCLFNRNNYLEYYVDFEEGNINDVQDELTEFNEDVEDMAYELAYTRYLLAKAEQELGKTMCLEFCENNVNTQE